jgi:outer membrane receptor protein involved in Fe transport
MATAGSSRYLFLPFLFAAIALFAASAAHAAHPLITEDTGTQGKGGFQLELSLERAIEDEHDLHEKAWLAAATLSYGLLDNLDLLVGGYYLHFHAQNADEDVQEHGFGDAAIDFKWRFFERGDLSIAVKSGLLVPAGDEDKGLSEGETRFNLSLVMSYEPDPWGFHLHLGSFANPGVFDWSGGIGHASAAVTYLPREDLKLVADIGRYDLAEPDTEGHLNNPMFLTLGAIWSFRENLDFDLGVRYGMRHTEVDWTFLLGTAIRW